VFIQWFFFGLGLSSLAQETTKPPRRTYDSSAGFSVKPILNMLPFLFRLEPL